MILPYFNFFVSIIEKLRKDVIEQLVNKLHHLTVFSLEETFELIALKRKYKEVSDLSFWKCSILDKKKKNTIIINTKIGTYIIYISLIEKFFQLVFEVLWKIIAKLLPESGLTLIHSQILTTSG